MQRALGSGEGINIIDKSTSIHLHKRTGAIHKMPQRLSAAACKKTTAVGQELLQPQHRQGYPFHVVAIPVLPVLSRGGTGYFVAVTLKNNSISPNAVPTTSKTIHNHTRQLTISPAYLSFALRPTRVCRYVPGEAPPCILLLLPQPQLCVLKNQPHTTSPHRISHQFPGIHDALRLEPHVF